MKELKSLIKAIFFYLCGFLPVVKNRVLFFSYYGAYYGCSPKYVSDAMEEKFGNKIKIIWALNTVERRNKPSGKIVRYGSPQFIVAFRTSKVICTNFNLPADLKKRRGQIYVQTWHNSLRLKRSHADVTGGLSSDFISMAKTDAQQMDYLCCGSEFMYNVMRNSFWYSGEIVKCGMPRNDILICNSREKKEAIKKYLGIPSNVKVLLYAPTFRSGGTMENYRLDIKRCLSALENKTGDREWIALLRLHPHLMNANTEGIMKQGFSMDVSLYDDISELLLITDVLITDYSSAMFDFSLTKRPVFLFAADHEEYQKKDFGFYFNLTDLPFPVAENNDVLIRNIMAFDDKSYQMDIERFRKKTGCLENGGASGKMADLIFGKMNQV